MPCSAHELENLVEECRAHLGREEEVLSETLLLVEQMRQTLRNRDREGLMATVVRLEQNQQRHETVHKERGQLQESIGRALCMPREQATLGALLTHIPVAWRHSLRSSRQRLQEQAKTIDRVNRANLALVASFSEILSRVLFDLTGQVTARRYGPSGRMDSMDSTLLIEKNC